MKNKGQLILKSPVTFTQLLADSAHEIRIGYLSAFPNGTIINCNFHVQKCIEKKGKELVKNEKLWSKILRDIKILQHSQDVEVFKKAAAFLIIKWEKRASSFVSFFKKNYIEQRSNWFEGVSMFAPSTNNAQEATHRVIKSTFTCNRRISVQEMKSLAGVMVKNWSLDLEKIKPFAEKVEQTVEELKEGYKWIKKHKPTVLEDPESDDDDGENGNSEET